MVCAGQILPYHQSPVRYFDQGPIQLGQNNVLQELK